MVTSDNDTVTASDRGVLMLSLEEAEVPQLGSPKAKMVLYCALNEQLLTSQRTNQRIKGLAFSVSSHKWE